MDRVIVTLDLTFSPAFPATRTKIMKTGRVLQRKHGLATSTECLCTGASVHKNGSSETHTQKQRPRRHGCKPSRGLITVRRSDGNWADSWTCQQMTSLKALRLEDLAAEDGQNKDDVIVNLSVQKHAGVGYSVDGRIISSVMRRCRCCCIEYCNQIDATFDAWCLSRNNSLSESQIAADISDDPFVIYFSPGKEEANLDDVVRDTIRLSCSIEATCSDACKKSEVRKWEFDDAKRASVDKRWLPILKAKAI